MECKKNDCWDCQTDAISFEARFYSESTNSVAVLIVKGKEAGSWNTKQWFPKSNCIFANGPEKGVLIVTAPKWLIEKLNIKSLLTTVCKL